MKNSKRFNWEIWIEDFKKCEKSFRFLLKKGAIKKETERNYLSKSHILKLNYNLEFLNYLIEERKFYDWAIVGCYYSIYPASLAPLSRKGYSSKDPSGTLCSLIYLFYKRGLDIEDLELISRSALEKQEISYFVDAKQKREIVSYGINGEHKRSEVLELKEKTMEFTNKVREILQELK